MTAWAEYLVFGITSGLLEAWCLLCLFAGRVLLPVPLSLFLHAAHGKPPDVVESFRPFSDLWEVLCSCRDVWPLLRCKNSSSMHYATGMVFLTTTLLA